MRVLVTGGAGFIGSHLCDSLMEDGTCVLCLDNLLSGFKHNIEHHLEEPGFEFILHDIVQRIVLEVDQIYNLACPASPFHYQRNPIKTVKANVLGTLNCLGIAKKMGSRILQASTSEIYGDPQVHPQFEGYWGHVNPVGVRSCYDEGKRIAETLMMDYHRYNKVDIRIARIFNTYGPRLSVKDGRVVSNFIVQALKKRPITVYGDGTQKRSFCYISDLISGLRSFMEAPNLSGPLNLGNPNEVSILELAETIREKIGTESEIVFEKLPEDDPVRRQPVISLAREELGWNPLISLSEGLEKTIKYFDAFLCRQIV